MSIQLNLILPLIPYWYCSKCGHQEFAGGINFYYPCHCDRCKAEYSVSHGLKRLETISCRCDSEPRSYNLANSSKKERQIYFYVPNEFKGIRGFTFGDFEPNELDFEDVDSVIDFVVERLGKYLYNGSLKDAQSLRKYIKESPKRELWKKNKLIMKQYELSKKFLELKREYDNVLNELNGER